MGWNHQLDNNILQGIHSSRIIIGPRQQSHDFVVSWNDQPEVGITCTAFNYKLGGGFNDFLFSFLFGEMIHFD